MISCWNNLWTKWKVLFEDSSLKARKWLMTVSVHNWLVSLDFTLIYLVSYSREFHRWKCNILSKQNSKIKQLNNNRKMYHLNPVQNNSFFITVEFSVELNIYTGFIYFRGVKLVFVLKNSNTKKGSGRRPVNAI